MPTKMRFGMGLALAAMLVMGAFVPTSTEAAGPRLSLSVSRAAAGTVVTMTWKNCSDPRLYDAGSVVSASSDSGNIYLSSPANLYVFAAASTWAGSGGTWTSDFV